MDYAHEVERMTQTNTSFALRARPWFYQTCSEFGWYQSTDSEEQPFSSKSPINYELRLCRDAFGDAFSNVSSEKNMHHTNVIYGGYSPAVTNVYFTQGSLDPWHPMGVWKDINDHSPGIMIKGLTLFAFIESHGALNFTNYFNFVNFLNLPGISHCRDMGSIDESQDSEELIDSKRKIRHLVKKWLKYEWK